MSLILIALIAIVIILITCLSCIANEINKYWLRRRIPFKKPLLFFGNSANTIFRRKHFTETQLEAIKEFPNEPVIGMFHLVQPILLVKDIDLIERILVKDFKHFEDRGFPKEKLDLFNANLFTLSGNDWRILRYKLTPLFTTNVLKTIYGLMAECSDYITSKLNQIDEFQHIDINEHIECFASNIIGTTTYGIDIKNLSQPDNEFRKMVQKALGLNSTMEKLKSLLVTVFPGIADFFKINLNDSKRDINDYFSSIIINSIYFRKRNDIVRNDFLQMFKTLIEKDNLELNINDEDDDYLRAGTMPLPKRNFRISDEIIVGNAFSFLNAGYVPIISSILFTLYELGRNMNIQEKVRQEIQKCVEDEGGSLTYDAIKKMTYLEQCVKEALRIYPPVPVLLRLCSKAYPLPNGWLMPVGEIILYISVIAVHKDPKIYPEPEKYLPERFAPDKKIPSCAFLPFGDGPRICIGMRFALLEIKHYIAKLLINHEYKLSPTTKPIRFNEKSFFLTPADPILFNITKIKKTV